MKRKTVIALITAFALLVAGGCGIRRGPIDQGGGDYTKLTGEVKFFLPGDEPANMGDVKSAINAALKSDGRNYTVNFVFEAWGTYWSKAPLKMNEGYDGFWMHADSLSSYIGQKVVLDISTLIESYGAKIKELTPDMYFSTVKQGSATYALPRVEPLSEMGSPFTLRADWLEEFGLTKVETLTELDTYITKSAQKVSGTAGAYVMDKDHSQHLRREYAKNYYFPLGSFSKHPVYIDVSQKIDGKYKVQNFYTSDAFINMAKKAGAYYDAGYRNPSRTSLPADNMDYAFNNSLLTLNWSTPTKTAERIDAFKELNPNGQLYNGILNPSETRWITGGSNMISVYSTSSRGAHVVDFYNWLLSDQDHADLVCYGIKDVNYKLTADGKLNFTGISQSNNYSQKFPSFVFNSMSNMRFSKSMDDAAVNAIKNWDSGENVKVSPLVGFTPTLSGMFNTAYGIVSSAEKSYSEDFLYGSRKVIDSNGAQTSDYKSFLNSLNGTLTYNGSKVPAIEIMITELQSQIDAYVAANGL